MADPLEGDLVDPIAELLTNYSDLNPSSVPVLDSEPSPLEFMRHVHKNTPFLVPSAASSWEATKLWTPAYLKSLLGSSPVNVAVTPNGLADSPTPFPSPSSDALVFAKPHEELQPFSQFLDALLASSSSSSSSSSSATASATTHHDPAKKGQEVLYAQTQNDNLRNEYSALFSHVQRDIPWARVALDREPEAVNLWIGTSASTTALHRDNYENVYVQVSGRKHFVLLPPACQPCVNEQMLEQGHYVRLPPDANPNPGEEGDEAVVRVSETLGLTLEPESDRIPFATWDPDRPMVNETEYSCLARPLRVTLNPGDILYLPAMWYHKVSQSCEQGGVCIAVNYWYDMDFTAPLYPLATFVRSVFNKEQEIESDLEDEGEQEE